MAALGVLGAAASVDAIAARLIQLVQYIVNEIDRARRDVATLKDEEGHLKKQYKKLTDRVTDVQKANAELREAHATKPELGESPSKAGDLEELLKSLEISLQSDLEFVKSLNTEEVKSRGQRGKKVFWALLDKWAAKVQKKIRASVNRIEEDCRQLDQALTGPVYASNARIETSAARTEVGVGGLAVSLNQVLAGQLRVEEIVMKGSGHDTSDLQSSTTAGAQKCGGLPEYLVPRQKLPADVDKTLMDGGTLGIFGMGGIGKSTLAKQVFNEISWKFEFTCFVDNVKGIKLHKLDKTTLGKLHQFGRGVRGREVKRTDVEEKETLIVMEEVKWTDLEKKKTLIVMDDVDSDEQLDVLPKEGEFGTGSLIIFTTRDGSLRTKHDIVFFEKNFLEPKDARQLFCQHAFNSKDIPGELQKMKTITKHVEDIVNKCDCLPLSLEVIGKHLFVRGDHENAEVWVSVKDKLSRAQPVGGKREDRLFATLQVSYDELAEGEQQMFRDIATFFFEKRLDVTLAARNTSKRKSYEATECWKNLVRRSLVKEIIQEEMIDSYCEDMTLTYQQVWMHEQL